MKLAPTGNTLQPIQANVQPAVSQNVQRAATQADIQMIQTVQTEQSEASAQQNSAPAIPFVQAAPSSSIVLWVALVIALVIAAAGVWFWRSF
jgi:hypothetical protein